MRKAEFRGDELEYLVKGISKQSVEGDPWFLSCCLLENARDQLKKELLKNQDFLIWEILACTNSKRC